MSVRNFKTEEPYTLNGDLDELLQKLDLQQPSKMVIDEHSSVPQLLLDYISTQTYTNNELLRYISNNLTVPTQVDGTELSVEQQQQQLKLAAEKQNLLCRQIERTLYTHLQEMQGNEILCPQDLINMPPTEFGTEQKVSDNGLRLITTFSGDVEDNESALNTFLREVYTLAQTSNLTEASTISVIIRKVSGSAQVLLDDYVNKKKGHNNLSLIQVVSLLERKFIMQISPLHSDAQLHTLSIGELTYSQLQAKIQKLARLACRKEADDKKETLTKVKEISAFLMAISAEDRRLINAENARRATDNLSSLTLDQMVDHLQTHMADKINYSDKIYNVRNDKDKKYQNRPKPPAKLKQKSKKFITFTTANVSKNCCLLCGSMTHKFTESQCPYYGQTLMQSPCRKCNVGVHPTKACISA